MLRGSRHRGRLASGSRLCKKRRPNRSLLVNPGEAQAFLHDPVHERAKPDTHLKRLRFLLGHFHGEGCYATGGYRFEKEVVGGLEAGGRFIALRMAASYPLADGRKDIHRALVIVGGKTLCQQESPAARTRMAEAFMNMKWNNAKRPCGFVTLCLTIDAIGNVHANS